jgi:hypothetical protein
VHQRHRRRQRRFGGHKRRLVLWLPRELLGQILVLQQIGQWCKDLGDFW